LLISRNPEVIRFSISRAWTGLSAIGAERISRKIRAEFITNAFEYCNFSTKMAANAALDLYAKTPTEKTEAYFPESKIHF
jgi:hypothetical protein